MFCQREEQNRSWERLNAGIEKKGYAPYRLVACKMRKTRRDHTSSYSTCKAHRTAGRQIYLIPRIQSDQHDGTKDSHSTGTVRTELSVKYSYITFVQRVYRAIATAEVCVGYSGFTAGSTTTRLVSYHRSLDKRHSIYYSKMESNQPIYIYIYIAHTTGVVSNTMDDNQHQSNSKNNDVSVRLGISIASFSNS